LYDKAKSKNIIGSKAECIVCRSSFELKTYNAKVCSEECKRINRLNRLKKSYVENIEFKIKHNLRTRLCKAIHRKGKTNSAIKDLGCSIEELKKHLESQFQDNMSWNNYGKHGWHIDHIIPLASFNLTDREEFLRANNYKNLQPLWVEDHLKKTIFEIKERSK